MPVTAYISLGSNMGDRAANLTAALEALRKAGVHVMRISRFVETKPVGVEDQPDFLNAAAEIRTDLSPAALLDLCMSIENSLGRVRKEKWGPRTIDLDILLYGDRIISEPNLQVPHPLMHERLFVLEPLAEIAPDARHSILKKTVAELLDQLRGKS